MSESHPYYERKQIEHAVSVRLRNVQPDPGLASITAEMRIVLLIEDIQRTVYNIGRMSVQEEVKKALHL